jgi:hypothetical protein
MKKKSVVLFILILILLVGCGRKQLLPYLVIEDITKSGNVEDVTEQPI